MSVNEPTNGTDSPTTFNVSANLEHQMLLDELRNRNGKLSRSEMVRALIRQEASRQGIAIPQVAQPS